MIPGLSCIPTRESDLIDTAHKIKSLFPIVFGGFGSKPFDLRKEVYSRDGLKRPRLQIHPTFRGKSHVFRIEVSEE
jgi:hypothetical protein